MKELPTIKIRAYHGGRKYEDKPVLVEAHVDPKHRDIVVNGFGISTVSAKRLRTWLNHAIRATESRVEGEK